ncbi:MAG: hypothetical protein FJ290_07215 [Planctomycetes bacterium]|nr:hypothetical protein [Planctomycetota bacterium]
MTRADERPLVTLVVLGVCLLLGFVCWRVLGWRWYWAAGAAVLAAGGVLELVLSRSGPTKPASRRPEEVVRGPDTRPTRSGRLIPLAETRHFDQLLGAYERGIAESQCPGLTELEAELLACSERWFGSTIYAEHEMARAQERAVDALRQQGQTGAAIRVCDGTIQRLVKLVRKVERAGAAQGSFYADEAERQRDLTLYRLDLAHMLGSLAYLKSQERSTALDQHLRSRHGVSLEQVTRGERGAVEAFRSIATEIRAAFPMDEELKLYGRSIDISEQVCDLSLARPIHLRGIASTYENVANWLSSYEAVKFRSQAIQSYEKAERFYLETGLLDCAHRVRQEIERLRRSQ